MADMLVELIQKFIDGSEATLNSLFKSMVNLVFFIERELNAIQIQGGSKIDFNGIYQVIFSYACFILVIVFISKLIKTYFLHDNGDPEKSPIHLVIGMLKAVIVMICFKEVYDIFVGITSSFLDSILNAMPVKTVSLSEVLTGNITGGIFTAVACLVLLITWLILICQFIMKRNRNVTYEDGNSICKYWTFKF
ncbi:MAG: conjugal transfer protein TrbL family protein [Clostridia bacterium]